MQCRSCQSSSQKKFIAEMGIRSGGLKNINQPVVWVFPEVIVCLDCGAAEFVVPDTELRLLAEGDAAGVG